MNVRCSMQTRWRSHWVIHQFTCPQFNFDPMKVCRNLYVCHACISWGYIPCNLKTSELIQPSFSDINNGSIIWVCNLPYRSWYINFSVSEYSKLFWRDNDQLKSLSEDRACITRRSVTILTSLSSSIFKDCIATLMHMLNLAILAKSGRSCFEFQLYIRSFICTLFFSTATSHENASKICKAFKQIVCHYSI